jgi:GT2 family glycosyltransferase
VRREANLGFIRNMNLGMALHPWRDVVWLNSDTRVHGDWLDRLQAAATQSPDTASATPFSNHGELMSFPASRVQHAMPDPAAHAQLDTLARGLADEAPPPLEMGCGFCMYIRRDALHAVGLLDETGLTRGYGEDSDWCLRARAAGWRHVAAPNVFVAHAGGVSFGAEKALRVRQNNAVLRRRYPDAEARFDLACVRDPVAPARQRLQRARLGFLREWIAAAAPCPAFAPAALRSPRRLHIAGPAPTGDADDPVDGIELRFCNDGQACRVSLRAALPPLPLLLDYRLPRDAEQLLQDLRSLPLEGMVYGALRGCPPELRELPARLGLPYLVRCEDDALLEPGEADFAAGARFVELPWRAQLERYRRALRGARLRCAPGTPAARSTEPRAVAPAAPLLIADALDRPVVCRRWLALARRLAREGSPTRLLLDHPTPWEHELLATGVVMPVPKLSGVSTPDLLRLAGCGAAVSLDDAPGAGWTAPRIAQRGGLALHAPASAMAREAAAAPLALAGIDLDGLEPAKTSVA